MNQIPLAAVRLLQLAAQGLLKPPARPAEKPDVLDAIRRMGALQIDTIHVVARSPYLVLFSRLGDYDPAWLDQHLAEGRLFEYWSHAACFLPIEDYPLYRHRMSRENQRYFSNEWSEKHHDTIETILARIRSDGPVRSADFERTDGQKGTWWNWKAEKMALEYLHTSGELMIARRENFQRIYDLPERVLPGWDERPALPEEAAHDELAVRAVRALGAAPARWVPDYYRLPKTGMAARLERLAEAERLLRVAVEGWKDPAYLHPENLSLLEWAASGELFATYTTLLSPFDPLVWDRARARELFGFDYTIECYTPEAKRRYGYFSLPILHEGVLVGRLDAKAHRKEGLFEVKSLHLEPGARPAEDLATAVAGAILSCAGWHGASQVVIRRSDPERFAALLDRFLAQA
jgi:uncharacterized protein YcaQ